MINSSQVKKAGRRYAGAYGRTAKKVAKRMASKGVRKDTFDTFNEFDLEPIEFKDDRVLDHYVDY